MSTREDFELKFKRLANKMDGTLRSGRLQSDGMYLVRPHLPVEWTMTAYFSGNQAGNDVEFAIDPSRVADAPYTAAQVEAWLDHFDLALDGKAATKRTGVDCWNRGFTWEAANQLLDTWLSQYGPLVERRWAVPADMGGSQAHPRKANARGGYVAVCISWPRVNEHQTDWPKATERMTLDLDGLSAGMTVSTVETSRAWAAVEYRARCAAYLRKDGKHQVSLVYTSDDNKEEAHEGVRWGRSRLSFADDFSVASATYEPVGGAPVHAVACEVRPIDLYEDLTRAQVNVLLRPKQARLREQLLGRKGPSAECAVTGETLPDALELAHLVPHSAHGPCIAENAILLRADLHAMFDAGKLHIKPDGTILLEPMPGGSRYTEESATWRKRLDDVVFGRVKAFLEKRSAPSEDV